MPISSHHLTPDAIRTLFSRALSDMYRAEVPLYGTLLDLVADANTGVLAATPGLDRPLTDGGELERLGLERHGAIRLGTSEELATMRRLFAIMGMAPVGYYDLSVAGVPVHATAFRPLDDEGLRRNPFRVFTSLLRLDLLEDPALRLEVATILARRRIYTPACHALIELAERNGGLTAGEAQAFVAEALETFRWHRNATVSADVYERLRRSHPLVADVVCFRGPHINHLTPRALDIDAVQAAMPERGITPKEIIEGPPRRQVPILLRQTSFRALREPVAFVTADGGMHDGTHTARFGEIEQRGAALTRAGRTLYDRLLAEARAEGGPDALARRFTAFPDNEAELREQGLAYFRYRPTGKPGAPPSSDLEALLAQGYVRAEPITYEDFLPVSAAGIFQSNLGDGAPSTIDARGDRRAFEQALGAAVADEFALYEQAEAASKRETLAALGLREAA